MQINKSEGEGGGKENKPSWTNSLYKHDHWVECHKPIVITAKPRVILLMNAHKIMNAYTGFSHSHDP